MADPVKLTWSPAAPNRGFPAELTAVVRFCRSDKPIPCASCGKKRRKFWTLLVPFHVGTFGMTVTFGEEAPALSLVCEDHLLKEAGTFKAALYLQEEIRSTG